jgi:carbohydrate kinase (thermoresistant glucokinase family)
MGVSGSGKTTIGDLLSLQTGIPFFDADDFHPISNKQKLTAGLPLNDGDREQWLHQLNAVAIEQSIIACSALKGKYRNILSIGIKPTWIFLQGDYELIYERMKNRDHFMSPQLLSSQFETLEVPKSAFVVEVENKPNEIVNMIVQYLKQNQ